VSVRVPLTPVALLAVTLALGACSRDRADEHVAAFARLPDWSGVWVADGTQVNIDGLTPTDPAAAAAPFPETMVFSQDIPWNDAGRAKVDAVMAATHGDPGINNRSGAGGWGYPLMMSGPAPMQFIVRPEVTLIVNPYRDLRLIYTDGREHLPAEEGWPPTTWGDSVGHWEADTLVIDTIGVREPDDYQGIAAPFSAQAHYSERLRRTAPNRIEGEMVVEDPATLTKPMMVKLAYVPAANMDRMIYDTFTNNRSGFDGEFNTIEVPEK